MRRRIATLLVVSAAALPVLAACADEETVRVTVTVRASTLTQTVPTTPTTPTDGGTTTAPPPTTSTTTAASLELRLPGQESIPGLQKGTPQELPSASSLVTALYAAGDPTAASATSRLEAAGYEQGVIRDQRQASGTEGPRLVRMYIFRLRDEAAAAAEVNASVQEIRATTSLPIKDVELPEARGTGLRIEGNENADILFVTFSAGRDVYGIQVFAQPGGKVFQPEVLELTGNLYRAWNNVP